VDQTGLIRGRLGLFLQCSVRFSGPTDRTVQFVEQEHAFKITGILATARTAHQVIVEVTRIISAWRSEGKTINGDAAECACGPFEAEVIVGSKDFQALISHAAARKSVQESAVSCELFLVKKVRALLQK